MPTVPVTAAGWRIEPPVSVPMASGAWNEATRRPSRRRAAGDAVEVPRVAGRAVRAVLGGGAHGELVHVGLAEDRMPASRSRVDERRVVRRDPALEDLRAARRRQALGGEDVLERERHTGERGAATPPRRGARRRRRPARARPRGRRGGRRARRRRRRRCGRGGPGSPRRADSSPGEQVGELGGGGPGEVGGHVMVSSAGGTRCARVSLRRGCAGRKRCCSARGPRRGRPAGRARGARRRGG